MHGPRLRYTRLTLLAVAILEGCASGSQLPFGAPHPASPSGAALREAAPPACKAQKKTKQYASALETLDANGDSLCVPRFGAFGGTIDVPMATLADKVTLTSSTTNYADVPLPKKSGSAIFYLNIAPASTTSFGARISAGGGLTGAGIKAKTAYTVYLEPYAFSIWRAPIDCYGVATAGKYGGVLGGLGSLLENQAEISALELFVYAGKSSSKKCRAPRLNRRPLRGASESAKRRPVYSDGATLTATPNRSYALRCPCFSSNLPPAG